MEQGRGGSKGERSTGSQTHGRPGCVGLSSPHLPAMSHSTCHGSQSPEGPASHGESQMLLLLMPRRKRAREPAPPNASLHLDKPRVHVGLKGPESPNWPQAWLPAGMTNCIFSGTLVAISSQRIGRS